MATMKENAHYNKTHYCRCQTKAIATVYREMSQEKKDIAEEMGFGALAHVSEMNVSNTLLIELLDRFDVERGYLKTLQGTIYITPRKIRNVLDMSVEGEENQKKFKKTFVVFIQKCFLLPTTVSVASPIHKPPIFHVNNIRECDWTKHVLNFLMKGVENKREGKKQSVDGCVFVLILIYFHETKFSRPFAPDAPPAPWVAYWTRKMIIERISSETTQPLVTRATPKSEVQIVEFQQQTRSKPLEVCPQEAEKQGFTVSLTSSVIEDLFKDDYVYEVSNEEPLEQQQQPCEEPTEQQSKQETPIDVCPPEPKKQGVTGSLTSSVIEEFFNDADVYPVFDEEQSQEPPMARQSEKETLILSSFDIAAQPREREDDRPSFSLGISPPASQPTQPSQKSDS
ncbi:hypothetical protein Ahy_B03g066438 [Arachis hypogaea]|uniref:Aminotransferase-like plant mobile domain-containing protein n=1 Tax=Arachis hypogaea TaxID=3818 RepID=A0A445A3Z7_ARAHY|nr:hypothetical protein Ahy_B03g066438 [Arachis hypogaea]